MLRLPSIALFVVCVAAGASSASAEGFRVGDPLERSSLADATIADEAVLSFTPRVPGVFDLDDARVTLTYRPIESASAAELRAGAVSSGFAVGGALALDGVVISGEIAQTSARLAAREDIEAELSVGAVTTRMGYAEVENVTGDLRSSYALGADLATAPGVAVGADLTYGFSDDATAAEEAAGMVRFRLSF